MSDPYSENVSHLASKYGEEVLSILFPGFHGPKILWAQFDDESRWLDIEFSPNYVTYPNSDYFFLQDKAIVHFTSKWALFSMLNERCFRQYQLNSTTDLREVNWLGEDLLNIDKGLLDKFKEQTFFGSFSEQEVLGTQDELLFWRLYGNHAQGVAITFSLKNAQPRFRDQSTFLGKISYRRPSGIDEFHMAHSQFLKDTRLDEVKNSIPLSLFACFHKSPSFNYEKEIRMISSADHFLPGISHKDFGMDFKGGGLVYYKKLPVYWQEEEPYLKMEEIYLGPGNTEKYKEGFEHVLMEAWDSAKLGYQRPVVKISSIEARIR